MRYYSEGIDSCVLFAHDVRAAYFSTVVGLFHVHVILGIEAFLHALPVAYDPAVDIAEADRCGRVDESIQIVDDHVEYTIEVRRGRCIAQCIDWRFLIGWKRLNGLTVGLVLRLRRVAPRSGRSRWRLIAVVLRPDIDRRDISRSRILISRRRATTTTATAAVPRSGLTLLKDRSML